MVPPLGKHRPALPLASATNYASLTSSHSVLRRKKLQARREKVKLLLCGKTARGDGEMMKFLLPRAASVFCGKKINQSKLSYYSDNQ
jgi:hypothetical protein